MSGLRGVEDLSDLAEESCGREGFSRKAMSDSRMPRRTIASFV